MRLFNAQLFDRHLEGDGVSIDTSADWACLLARGEALRFTCVVDQVSATPTLTISLFGGNADENRFELTKQLFSIALSAGGSTSSASYSSQDANWPPPRHVFVQATINGAGGKAHVRLWVCGRGPQLLEAVPTSSSFAAQYAMAKMLEDEDRLPIRKRSLKQGASLFYPPEVLSPWLKWER